VKAVQIFEYGGKEKLKLIDAVVPQARDDEVLVRLNYAGVNFIDIYMREGYYRHSRVYGSELPLTLGMEGSGVVEMSGSAVKGVKRGDRVIYCLSPGSYAQCAVVPAWKLVKVPDEIPLDVATALMLQGCTAHYLSHTLFPLGPEHACLFHAGAGGVGQLFVQLARSRGARVLATVGSREKADIVRRLGAEPILYREVDFRDAVMRLTGEQGVDVVYDSVGQETIDRSLRCLRRRGLCVNFGGSAGIVETIRVLDLAEAGSLFFTRPNLAHYMADSEEIGGRMRHLFAAVVGKRLSVAIDRKLALESAADAHAAVEGRQTKGKILLTIQAEK
jgi:NADPH2:quinone reductase